MKAKCSPMFCAYRLWAWNGVSRATSAVFIFHRPAPIFLKWWRPNVWWRNVKFSLMLSTYDIWSERDFLILLLLLWHGTCFCEGPLLLAVIYKKKQEVLRNFFLLGSSRGSMKFILILNSDADFFLNFITITMTQNYTLIECGRYTTKLYWNE